MKSKPHETEKPTGRLKKIGKFALKALVVGGLVTAAVISGAAVPIVAVAVGAAALATWVYGPRKVAIALRNVIDAVLPTKGGRTPGVVHREPSRAQTTGHQAQKHSTTQPNYTVYQHGQHPVTPPETPSAGRRQRNGPNNNRGPGM